MRGSRPCRQPLQSQDIDGQERILCWNGDVFNQEIPEGISDTEWIKQRLDNIEEREIPDFMAKLEGPFAFVYFRQDFDSSGKIWFGRDRLGRHSMLISKNHLSEMLVLTSVVEDDLDKGKQFVELPASGIFEADLGAFMNHEEGWIRHHKWRGAKGNIEPSDLRFASSAEQEIGEKIVMIHDESSIPRPWETVEDFLLENHEVIEGFEKALEDSVRIRTIGTMPSLCRNCARSFLLSRSSNAPDCDHPKIGILFSGGLDSAVLASLADRVISPSESIALINVSFGGNHAPDRQTARQALRELRASNPSRTFEYFEIDVSKEELIEKRKDHIRHLLYPLETVLDDSIGCALWFAGRGAVHCSPVRVLLLGMGADEQLGGYTRHRVRFKEGGWKALTEEMSMELDRISERNLGRDNRILSDHGVAPRCPYLDEKVVRYLASLPTHEKTDLRLPRGLGEKIILRALAHKLGLTKTAREPKRAIQFGSKIAKLENRKEKGNDVAKRL